MRLCGQNVSYFAEKRQFYCQKRAGSAQISELNYVGDFLALRVDAIGLPGPHGCKDRMLKFVDFKNPVMVGLN